MRCGTYGASGPWYGRVPGLPFPGWALQHQLIEELPIAYFNSPDHDTTLTNIAAGRGICLAPGFLNDHNQEFAWIPFDTKTVIPCALYTHKNDRRTYIKEFVAQLQQMYRQHPDFAV